MTQEEKDLLLKDLCARLPYGVKAQVLGWDEEKGEVEVPLKIYSINTDGYIYFETNDYDVNYLPVEECRLYLRPMSSMTEEEKKEFIDAVTWEANGKFYIDECEDISFYQEKCDWLNAHHFDYRGLIEKGLAIEVSEDYKPYKQRIEEL